MSPKSSSNKVSFKDIRFLGFLGVIKDGILGNPEDYHGKNFVTEDVKKSSQITNGVITISNGIDGISIYPLLLISLEGSVPLALLSATILTVFTNYLGNAAATGRPGNQGWSKASLIGLIAMNAVMSATSLVAPTLLLGQSEIAEIRSDEFVVLQTTKVNKIRPSSQAQQQLYEAKSECERLQSEISKYPQGTVQRDDFYMQAYGVYRDQNQDWSQVPVAQQPWCVRFKTSDEQVREIPRQAQIEWSKKEAQIKGASSTLAGIKQVLPELYRENFTKSGYVSSGTEAARIAIEITYGKLLRGEWTKLGFNIFSFTVSIVTSTVSVFVGIYHSRRTDVQMSFNDSLSILYHEYEEGNLID
jgi:hypothetical protein